MGPAVERLVVKLARVTVPPHRRFRNGRWEDVKGYSYERDLGLKSHGGASNFVKKNQEGGSVRPRSGWQPVRGYMVALPGHEETIDPEEFSEEWLDGYIKRHPMVNNPPYVLGWWLHEGRLYFDVSENVQTELSARKRGKARKQIAVWDVARGEEITLSAKTLKPKKHFYPAEQVRSKEGRKQIVADIAAAIAVDQKSKDKKK